MEKGVRKIYPDGVIMVPSDLRRQATQQAVLVTLLKPQNPDPKSENQLMPLCKHQMKIENIELVWIRKTHLRASGITILFTLS